MQERSPEISLRLDQQLCFPLYATSRQMTRLYAALLEPLGLTYPQYLVLLVLWEKAPRTVTEIGTELQLNTNTLTPVLKRLEQSKLLARTRSRADERVVEVALTAEGRALREGCVSIPDRLFASIDFDTTKANVLRELLSDLNSRLSAAVSELPEALSQKGPFISRSDLGRDAPPEVGEKAATKRTSSIR